MSTKERNLTEFVEKKWIEANNSPKGFDTNKGSILIISMLP